MMTGEQVGIQNATAIEFAVEEQSLCPEASDEFVITPYIEAITKRALSYLAAGYPVHFAGPAGTGKTTMAFHVAAQLGRPVTLLHGNDEFGTSDLVGKDTGYRRRHLVDNFIHSVVKTEEEVSNLWMDNRLTIACRSGDTLIYDEFNRSRPEANNVLLSVLSEGILNLPGLRNANSGYFDIHRDFRVIFTSNPEEYAGTHKTQDALVDRMITINLDYPDPETEVAIVAAKSGLARAEAESVMHVVWQLRNSSEHYIKPSIRAGIAIGRILSQCGERVHLDNVFFHRVCHDVLGMGASDNGAGRSVREKIDAAIHGACSPAGPRPRELRNIATQESLP